MKTKAKGKADAKKSPLFITKTELAAHLGCHIESIERWVAAGTIPPPHSRPGVGHTIWLRRHFDAYVESGEWPRDAYVTPARS